VGSFLGDTIGALALGLVAGHTLGLCYFLYKHKWDELDDVQHKYVYVSMFLASAVGVYSSSSTLSFQSYIWFRF
jgi:hypothetical protein